MRGSSKGRARVDRIVSNGGACYRADYCQTHGIRWEYRVERDEGREWWIAHCPRGHDIYPRREYVRDTPYTSCCPRPVGATRPGSGPTVRTVVNFGGVDDE